MSKTSSLADTLKNARDRYEDKLLHVERIWSTLKPDAYEARKQIIDLTNDLIEIDRSLKAWEAKL